MNLPTGKKRSPSASLTNDPTSTACKPLALTLNMFHCAEDLTPTLCSHHTVNLCVVYSRDAEPPTIDRSAEDDNNLGD